MGSRYNPRLSVIDNIHLPPSLLSRFDLIYLVLDRATPEHDKKLAHHLVSMYYENRPAPLQVTPAKPQSGTAVGLRDLDGGASPCGSRFEV